MSSSGIETVAKWLRPLTFLNYSSLNGLQLVPAIESLVGFLKRRLLGLELKKKKRLRCHALLITPYIQIDHVGHNAYYRLSSPLLSWVSPQSLAFGIFRNFRGSWTCKLNEKLKGVSSGKSALASPIELYFATLLVIYYYTAWQQWQLNYIVITDYIASIYKAFSRCRGEEGVQLVPENRCLQVARKTWGMMKTLVKTRPTLRNI